MTVPTTTLPAEHSISDGSHTPATTLIPSWLASVVLHGLLLFLFASSLKSCQSPTPGDPTAVRQVGIYIKDTNSTADDIARENQSDSPAETTAAAAESEAVSPENNATPPAPLSLPSIDKPTLGSGAPPISAVPGDLTNVPRVKGITSPDALTDGGGRGSTSLFGISDKGATFVYVIDCSGSMTNHNAIAVAKAQFKASINVLEKTQQFQVIFYNQHVRLMRLRADAAPGLYWASDTNKRLARQDIAGVRADLGTRHMPALRKALSYRPEVVYFLTDADMPVLEAADLAQIARLNGGRTRIHCIEFGTGPQLKTDNFLKQLARQNEGSYRYWDVTEFDRR